MKQNNNDKGRERDETGNKQRVTNDQGRKGGGEDHRKRSFPDVVDTVAPPSKDPGKGSGNAGQG